MWLFVRLEAKPGKQAAVAAEMALRIMAGEKPERIPVRQDSGNEFVFDYREMQRFNLEP